MISDIVNQDTMPLAYKLSSDNRIGSVITQDFMLKLEIASAVVIGLISIYLIIKYKFNGLKSAILSIGYIGLITIIVRYTNVIITINSLIAIVAVVVLNYVFNIKYLKELTIDGDKKKSFVQSIKNIYLTVMPLCIIAVIFTLMSSVVISSIGMILFWGLFVQAIYSCLLLV